MRIMRARYRIDTYQKTYFVIAAFEHRNLNTEVAEFGEVLMPENGVVVEIYLGVESDEAVVLGQRFVQRDRKGLKIRPGIPRRFESRLLELRDLVIQAVKPGGFGNEWTWVRAWERLRAEGQGDVSVPPAKEW